MKITKRMLSSKGFIKNIILLVSGTLLAQSVSIISSPILTRIYSPEAFGELGVFTSITSIFSVFMCLRYELALVIPKEKEYALRFKGKTAAQDKYTGRILAVGISYNKETKEHSCKVEEL